MNSLDWTILAAYMGGMILLSVRLGRGQSTQEDYYVGGRNLPWWAVAVSTMATQTSAISFISVPAFVAMREGGGLSWLQYELAVPLAMIVAMVLLLPLFRRLGLVSVYEYLELRFGVATRSLLAGVFLLARGLATGAGLYASGIVLSVCLGMDLAPTILLIGVVTLIYDTIGGMAAVVYSDVIQMVILVGGVVLCTFFALDACGGWGAALAAHEPVRFVAIQGGTGLGDGSQFPLWGFVVGGFFLYASYYGCDQSQAQRELSTRTLADTKYSLVFNGLARLPLTFGYVVLGIAVGAVFNADPSARQLIPQGNADYMVPAFVLHYLPHGVKAVIFSAILAAAMSSLDSALNSLSAATMRDFVERFWMPRDASRLIWFGKGTTVAWGLLIIGFAFVLGGNKTVVELINQIGSAFYGPVLAAFVTGVLSRRVNGAGMIAGIIAGVGCNLALWLGAPSVFWMWWNASGWLVAVVVAQIASRVTAPPEFDESVVLDGERLRGERAWLPAYAGLAGYFAFMLAILHALPGWLGRSR